MPSPPTMVTRPPRHCVLQRAAGRRCTAPRRPLARWGPWWWAPFLLVPLVLRPAAPARPHGAPSAATDCGWREPPRTYPAGARWSCAAVDWTDGDTLSAKCEGGAGTVDVRLRGLDADERGKARWRLARDELRRRTEGRVLNVLPHHRSHRRVVADVLAGGVNVGVAMDAAGWSKANCPKR